MEQQLTARARPASLSFGHKRAFMLLQIRFAMRLSDDNHHCVRLWADVVRLAETTGFGTEAVRYVAVNWEEMKGYDVPCGSIDLRGQPDDGSSTLRGFETGIGYIFDGPVFYAVSVEDTGFDPFSLVGTVYAVEGRGESQRFEPFSYRPVTPVPQRAFQISLRQLGFSARVVAGLEAEGLMTAAELCVRAAAELREILQLSEGHLVEIRNRLTTVGLCLMGEAPS